MSIEDHKWLFDYHVFMPDWLSLHLDLTCDEFARVMQMAWKCQKRIMDGGLLDPDEYEKIPYAEGLESRISDSRNYLKSLISRLNLASKA